MIDLFINFTKVKVMSEFFFKYKTFKDFGWCNIISSRSKNFGKGKLHD